MKAETEESEIQDGVAASAEELQRQVQQFQTRLADLERENETLRQAKGTLERAHEQQAEQAIVLRERITELEAEVSHMQQVETALLENELRYQRLVETLPDSVVLTDLEGKILICTQKTVDIYGYERPDDMIGTNAFDWIVPEDRARALHNTQKTLAGEDIRNVEYTMLRKDGTRFYAELNASLLRDAEGQPQAFIGVTRDVTERKRMEEALREREARYRKSIENTLAGYFFIDREGRFRRVNDAWLRMHGYTSVDEIIGKHFSVTQVEADMAEAKHKVERLLKGETLPTGEFSRQCKDGSVGYHSFSAHPVVQGGEVIGLEGFLIDTTEHRWLESALRVQRDLAVAISESENFPTVGTRLLEILCDLDEVDCGGVYQVAGDGMLDLVAYQNLPDWFAELGAHYDVDDPQAQLVKEGEPTYAYFPEFELAAPNAVSLGLRALVVLPVQYQGRTVAVINLASYTKKEMSAVMRQALESIVAQMGGAIARVRATEALRKSEAALRRRNRDLALLNEASHTFNATLRPDSVFDLVLATVRDMLGVQDSSIWLAEPHPKSDDGSPDLVCRYFSNRQNVELQGWRLSWGMGVAGWVAQNGRSMLISDTRNTPQHFKGVDQHTGMECRSILAVPLWGAGSVLGVLELVDTEPYRFTKEDVQIIEPLATTAAIAIRNAQLYEQTQRDAEMKALLLREVNHRVSNNLLALKGVLRAERVHMSDEHREAMSKLLSRLSARLDRLCDLHRMLSESQWSDVLLSDLARQLVRSATVTLPSDWRAQIDVAPSPVQVSPKQAGHLALIMNELVMNTIKYARRRSAESHPAVCYIAVNITCDDGWVTFKYRDNGPGYPEPMLRFEEHNVGMYLVKRLVTKSLRGELTLTNADGALTTLRFPLKLEA